VKTIELAYEMREAYGAMTSADIRELVEHGVNSLDIVTAQLVGIARICRIPDTALYEPDQTGSLAFVTPVLVEDPMTPESRCPETFVRYGNLVDLVAWDPQAPRQWVLRTGVATWLGCAPAQYLDPEPVPVRRSILSWLRADCRGIVALSQEPGDVYSLLMSFPGGLLVEDEVHARELRQILERPWPLPPIIVDNKARAVSNAAA
jgi:hypothetical protein